MTERILTTKSFSNGTTQGTGDIAYFRICVFITSTSLGTIDENGEYVLDENGERILVMPYRSWGGAVIVPTYDWATNPENYYAELYEEGMTIFGNPSDVEIM